jgi:hypothetical protein
MNYSVDIGLGAQCIPSSIKIGSSIQKVMGKGTHTDMQTYRQEGDLISLLLFFQNKESRLKVCYIGP